MNPSKYDKKTLKADNRYKEIVEELCNTKEDRELHRIAKVKLRLLKKEFKRKFRAENKDYRKKYTKEKGKPSRIENFAKILEADLPKSEQWFRSLYIKEEFKRTFSEDLFKDKFNKPFNSKYIPDVTNIGYKYIIEIDGSIHNTPDQIFKDKIKDYYFTKRGYLVIRVKHYDLLGYNKCIELIKARIIEIDNIELKRRNNNVS
jgi:very-short-patch-repair endonuclease